MTAAFAAVYEEVPASEGGGYLAFAEELPDAISEGDTIEEARENLRDAIELVLEANRELTGKRSPGKKITREKIQVSVACGETGRPCSPFGTKRMRVLLRERAKHFVYYHPAAQRTSTVPRHCEIMNPTAI